MSIRHPRGWQLLAPPISNLSNPQERLLLTSYPAERGGGCGPSRAARALPATGVLVYLFEYRKKVGDPWAQLHRENFPPRPEHFKLRKRDLASHECMSVPSYMITFRSAGRPFQMHVALGEDVGPRRRARLLRTIDSLRFTALDPPPPDPYAGWRELIDETGDSIRMPPGWSAATTTSPRRYSRPRTLFFASNRALPGLASAPARSARQARRLPSAFPAGALSAFPDDGVLLWVREERKGPASDAYPTLPRHRPWPQSGDFATQRTGPARRWPKLRWQRAAGQQRGHRFSVWVISAGGASESDQELARRAASALALAPGPFRDTPCRRACRTG